MTNKNPKTEESDGKDDEKTEAVEADKKRSADDSGKRFQGRGTEKHG